MDANQILSTKQWQELIAEKVTTALGAKLGGAFIPASLPGDFHYVMKEQYYNKDSLHALDSLVRKKDGISSLGDSFSRLYYEIIDNVEYVASKSDQEKMDDEVNSQQKLVASILDLYVKSGIDEEADEYTPIAEVLTKFFDAVGTDDLKKANYKKFPHLAALGNEILKYTKMATLTNAFSRQFWAADQKLNAIRENLTDPSKENGGLAVSKDEYLPGWDKLTAPKTIASALSGKSSISISITANNFSSETSHLSIDGRKATIVPFAWFFTICKTAAVHYDLSKYASSGAAMSIKIEYKGITEIPAIPTPLTLNNQKGWYAGDILKEIAARTDKDCTGIKLIGDRYDASKLFGQNGELCRFNKFIICQPPAITIKMTGFETSQIKEFMSSKTNVGVALFGGLFNFGSMGSGDYSVSKFSSDSKSNSLEVVIEPGKPDATPGKDTAFILGGVPEVIPYP